MSLTKRELDDFLRDFDDFVMELQGYPQPDTTSEDNYETRSSIPVEIPERS